MQWSISIAAISPVIAIPIPSYLPICPIISENPQKSSRLLLSALWPFTDFGTFVLLPFLVSYFHPQKYV
jgi:hypothetical protein